jgi:hypothetical protein
VADDRIVRVSATTTSSPRDNDPVLLIQKFTSPRGFHLAAVSESGTVQFGKCAHRKLYQRRGSPCPALIQLYQSCAKTRAHGEVQAYFKREAHHAKSLRPLETMGKAWSHRSRNKQAI